MIQDDLPTWPDRDKIADLEHGLLARQVPGKKTSLWQRFLRRWLQWPMNT